MLSGLGRAQAESADPERRFVLGESEETEFCYSRLVGARLRQIRKQMQISLQDVEQMSRGEFRASVVGAYERGERSLSLPRLHRLAELYAVPIAQLLPIESSEGAPASDIGQRTEEPSSAMPLPVVLNLVGLHGNVDAELDAVRRYVSMLQVERQDFNGTMLSVRRDDLRTIAAMVSVPVDSLVSWLGELGLLHDPELNARF